jgi:hypothetical protein
MPTKKQGSTPKKATSASGKPIEMGRRVDHQLRFKNEDYQELLELAIKEGYISMADIGKQPKVKAGIERMIINKTLGREPKEE